jgi:hypothetical protein
MEKRNKKLDVAFEKMERSFESLVDNIVPSKHFQTAIERVLIGKYSFWGISCSSFRVVDIFGSVSNKIEERDFIGKHYIDVQEEYIKRGLVTREVAESFTDQLEKCIETGEPFENFNEFPDGTKLITKVSKEGEDPYGILVVVVERVL